MNPGARPKLAVVLSHPTQYYSPWFRHITEQGDIELSVFYLWEAGTQPTYDRQFERTIQWDIPLLDGYRFVFVPNRSRDPGTHRMGGLDNPTLVALLAQSKPDAILLFGYSYLSQLRLILAPRLAHIPLLMRGDSHDLARAQGWKPKLSRRLRALLFRRFAAFLAVGQANAAYFRNGGVSPERIHHVPHCVDNERFQSAASHAAAEAAVWREELGIPAAAKVVLFAGKFEDKKRPLDLLTAFARVCAQRNAQAETPAVLLLVGSGPLQAQLQCLAGEALGRSVFFQPFQNQTQMPKVYAIADVMVLPSCGDGETWGLAVNEAMNLARPCIVSTHVGCGPDLVIEGQTGWTFQAGDVTALTSVLAKALDAEREVLGQMGQAARCKVGHYSYGAATAALIAALHAVLPSGSSTPSRSL